MVRLNNAGFAWFRLVEMQNPVELTGPFLDF